METVGRRIFGKLRRRWEDNIKMDLKYTVWGGGGVKDWINVAQDTNKVVGSFECGNEPFVSIKGGEFLD
jgi:hypothetical protein